MGVEFHTNVIVGKSITLKQLKEDGFDAIFICSGAGLPKMMGIKGENLNGVFSANEFLTRVNLMGAGRGECATPLKIGKKLRLSAAVMLQWMLHVRRFVLGLKKFQFFTAELKRTPSTS